MFYQTDGDSGLYGYSDGSWVKLQKASGGFYVHYTADAEY